MFLKKCHQLFCVPKFGDILQTLYIRNKIRQIRKNAKWAQKIDIFFVPGALHDIQKIKVIINDNCFFIFYLQKVCFCLRRARTAPGAKIAKENSKAKETHDAGRM